MKDSVLTYILKHNSEEKIKDILNRLYLKLETLNKRNDKISLLMGLIVLTYFIVDRKILTKINIGPLNFDDTDFVKLFIPMAFAFILLIYSTINIHRSKLIENIKFLQKEHYNLFMKKEDKISVIEMYFSPILLPFSIYDEISFAYTIKGKVNFLIGFLVLPVFLLIILPFYFEYIILKDIITNYWHNGLLEKSAVIITLWLLLIVLVIYLMMIVRHIKKIEI